MAKQSCEANLVVETSCRKAKLVVKQSCKAELVVEKDQFGG